MKDLEYLAADILATLGVPSHLDGYHYLRLAVAMYACRLNQKVRITADIYPAVAEEFGTTVQCVEHSSREAISKTFEKGNESALKELFGYAKNRGFGRVTNKNFIVTLALKIAVEQRAV